MSDQPPPYQPPPPPPQQYAPPPPPVASFGAPPPPPAGYQYGAPPPPPAGYQYGAPPPPSAGYQYGAPPPVIPVVQRRRSGFRRVLRWLGILAIVTGVAGGAFSITKGFLDESARVQAFARGETPAAELELEKGDFTIFAEGPGLTETRGSGDTSECIHCSDVHARSTARITSEDGESIAVADFGFTNSYEFAGHEGVAIGTVFIPEAGDYTVELVSDFSAVPITHVAVGEYSAGDVFVAFGYGFAFLFGGIILGSILLAVSRWG